MTEPRAPLSDDEFEAMRARARPYTAVILHPGPNRGADNAMEIIYRHGMRNTRLYLDGTMPIVCPTADRSDFSGVGIFDATPETVAAIMDADPAVRAGILRYELHPVRGWPGSTLPD